MKKGYGKFYVTMDIINESNLPEILYKMKFIPYKVEYLAMKDKFLYEGVSPLFKEIESGVKIPFYDVIINTNYNLDKSCYEIGVVGVKRVVNY